MKTPEEIFDELTPMGKLFCWWIIPVYYMTKVVISGVALFFYGIYSAWCDDE